MRLLGRFHTIWIVLISFLCFLVLPAGVHGRTAEEGSTESVGLIDVKECEGVEVTQCELAKNLILTLKMGEDLTCEACFIQLQALGIAPGEDWSYADPHTVATPEDMKEVVLEVHEAYNTGTVRLDGFEVAADLNRFCRDIKGPPVTPPPTEQREKKTETEAEVEPKAETASEAEPKAEAAVETETLKEAAAEKETSATPPSQDAQDKTPAPSEEAEQEEMPSAGAQESDKPKETSD